MKKNFQKIILGSGSPRRKQLLEGLGLNIEVRVKDIPEEAPNEIKGSDIAVHLAEFKAASYKTELKKNEILITADTIVWMDDQLFGKPIDRSDAIRMLTLLAGRCHQVFTGVSLTSSTKQLSFYSESNVWFRPLSNHMISDYVDHYRPYDKAGAYGAQECLPENVDPCSEDELNFLTSVGKPGLFEECRAADTVKHVPVIDHIDGSFFNVMGLPIAELWRRLEVF